MNIKFLILAVIFFVLPMQAQAWPGVVVKVTDGDTMTVQNPEGKNIVVRLFGVDTPEYPNRAGKWGLQPGAEEAARYIKAMLLPDGPGSEGQRVTIIEINRDRYGRDVSFAVELESGLTVQEMLLIEGLAWVDPKYCRDSRPVCVFWKELEAVARESRVGLWGQKNPVPPWVWRGRED